MKILLKVKFKTLVKSSKGPIVYYVLRWRGGGQFSKSLDFQFGGANFENAQNVRGVEILRYGAGLLRKSCQTII